MKRLAILAATLLLSLSGCAVDPASEGDSSTARDGSNLDYRVSWVDLADGTEVKCVAWSGTQKGGLSCDWDNRRKKIR